MSKDPNHITFRVSNKKILRFIEELTTKFKNKSTVLNEILDIGAPILYARIFGKGRDTAAAEGSSAPDTTRELKELRLDCDDIFVMLNILEPMLAALFNIALAQLENDTVNPQELKLGLLGDLPPALADMKKEIVKRHAKRKGRQQ